MLAGGCLHWFIQLDVESDNDIESEKITHCLENRNINGGCQNHHRQTEVQTLHVEESNIEKTVAQLKNVKRSGWIRCGIPLPESVADHSFMMAAIAFAIPQASLLDRSTCIQLAVVHDIAESIVGDITPYDGISKKEKSKIEQEAISRIACHLNELDAAGAETLSRLWQEYEHASTPEARFVKDVDKFEMLLQADIYERKHPTICLQQFFDSTTERITTEVVKTWVKELVNKRTTRLAVLTSPSKPEK
eukprot:gene5631-204_t